MRELRASSRVCDRAREYSSRALDGELSDFERALLENHLERCESCRAYAAELGEIVGRLRMAPLEPVPHQVTLPSRRRARTRVFQGAAAAAVAAVALTAGLVGSLHSERPANARPSVNLNAFINSTDFHSQDVQELHQMRAASLRPPINLAATRGGGQQPA